MLLDLYKQSCQIVTKQKAKDEDTSQHKLQDSRQHSLDCLNGKPGREEIDWPNNIDH